MSITELSIKRPILIVIIFIALIFLGILAYSNLKYELIPDVSFPMITIITTYPGASPKEVETSVTKIIEDAVSSVNKLQHTSSTSMENTSIVMLTFTMEANSDLALQDVQRKVNAILNKLPGDASTPILSKMSASDTPIIKMIVSSEIRGSELYQYINNYVKPAFSKIKGIGEVTLIGGSEREIKININSSKLDRYNISIDSIVLAIKSSNADFPAGNIKDKDGQYTVRISGKLKNLDELKNIIITSSSTAGNIKLMDIAEIEDGIKEPTTICRFNGIETLGIQIQRQSGANSVEVSKLIKKEINKIEEENKDQKIKFTLTSDTTEYTLESANDVLVDIFLAIILVGIIMLIFLHSFRNLGIIMISIPASLFTAFIGMYFLDYSLNITTLLALSLVIGILVDDSIVVLENIHRHLVLGKDKIQASIDGRKEIGFSAVALTLVVVVVFFPISLVGGMVGKIFSQFALVIVITTLISLFVSFTLTPMLSSRFGKLEHFGKNSIMGKFGENFDKFFEKITTFFLKLLNFGLKRKKLVILSALILFIGSFSLIISGAIGMEFMSEEDRGEISVSIELPQRMTLNQTSAVAKETEKILFNIPEIESIFTNDGASSSGFSSQSSNNNSEMNITLVKKRKRNSAQICRIIETKLQTLPGVKVKAQIQGMMGNAELPVSFLITGTKYDDVYSYSLNVIEAMKKVKGTGEIRTSVSEGKPERRIVMDREEMANLGLTLLNVGSTLRTALTGNTDAEYKENDTNYTIRIFLDQFDRSKTSDLEKLKFTNNAGKQIELTQFAKIYNTFGPNQLTRYDRVSSITVSCQANGLTSRTIGNEIKNNLLKDGYPKGITLSESGSLGNQGDAFLSIIFAILVGIIFVYFILTALYESFLYPLVVIFSLPMAIIGALVGLAIAMKSLNLFSMLGMIMLMGIVAKNAILLVDRTNQNIEKGENITNALNEAVKTRLRPIMMTTIAMVFGMLPVALGLGASGNSKSSIGVVLIGGLLSSLFLTLIFVPVIYAIFESLKLKFIKKKNNIIHQTIE